MADISFDNDPTLAPLAPANAPAPSLFIQLVLRTGVVSSERAAQNILLISAVVGLALAGFLLWNALAAPGISAEQLQQIQLEQKAGKLPFVPS